MRKLAISVVAAGMIGSAAAQRTGPLPPLITQVEVHVVNVDVSVTDANGKPVLDLTKDDFEIFEDGRPQKVTNYYVIRNADVRPASANAAATVASPAVDPFRRKFVLLVDNNYIDKIQRDIALAEIDRFVDGAFNGEHEWAIGAISQRLEILHPFTTDKKEIHAAIDKIRNSGAFPEQHAIDRSILSDRLRRMEVMNPTDYASLIPTIDYGEVVRFQAREQTYRALRAIRVTAAAVREMTRAHAAYEGKKVLILLTGGMETHTDFAAYNRDKPDRAIKVRVKRSRVNVADRTGYVALSPEDHLEQFLQARFSAEEKLGSLPVKVKIGAAVPRQDGVSVPVLTMLPMDRLTVIPIDGEYVGRVHVYVSVFDHEGKNLGFNHQMQEVRLSQSQYHDVGSANFRYKLNVQLGKGAFMIVITLRDDLSNEIGSASEPVTL